MLKVLPRQQAQPLQPAQPPALLQPQQKPPLQLQPASGQVGLAVPGLLAPSSTAGQATDDRLHIGAAGSSGAQQAWGAEGEEDDDAFFGAIDVDSMVLQAAAAGPLRPSLQVTQRLTVPSSSIPQQQQAGWRASEPGQVPATASIQHPVSLGCSSGGPLCSHGVPLAGCTHRQQHLDEITRKVADAAMQMADAEGHQLQELQQEVKRLRGLKQLLEAAQLPAVATAGPAITQAQGVVALAPRWKPPPPPQQHNIGVGEGAHGPLWCQQARGGGQRDAPPPPQQQQWGNGGAGGSYDAVPPHPLWEADRAVLQIVAAEREDATNDPQ